VAGVRLAGSTFAEVFAGHEAGGGGGRGCVCTCMCARVCVCVCMQPFLSLSPQVNLGRSSRLQLHKLIHDLLTDGVDGCLQQTVTIIHSFKPAAV